MRPKLRSAVVVVLAVLGCALGVGCKKDRTPGVGSRTAGMGGFGGGGSGGDSPMTAPVVTFLGEFRFDGLRAPTRIAMGGPRERIVVSDPGSRAVHVLTRTGVLRFSIPVAYPLGVAVDASGTIYIGDRTTEAVRVYDSTGKLLRQFGGGPGTFKMPNDIAVDPATNLVHVVDSEADLVSAYDAQGTLQHSYGGSGTGNGLLSFPIGITIDRSAHSYVVDANNARLAIFSTGGAWNKAFGTYGVDKTQYMRPQGLAIDGQSRIYVTDAYNDRLQVVDGNGLFISWVGQPGIFSGQLSQPLDVLLDSYNRLVVTSLRTSKVVVYGVDNYRVPSPEAGIAATVTVEPSTINPGSEGKWLTVIVELPGQDVKRILLATARLQNVLVDSSAPVEFGDADGDGVPDLKVKFLRAQVLVAIGTPGEHQVTFSADLDNGDFAEGQATVNVLALKGQARSALNGK